MSSMKLPTKRCLLAACFALGLSCGPVLAEDPKFDIQRYEVRGNTLLSADEIAAVVAPFQGTGRVYGNIQQALEALENAYRAKGFGTVNVHVPEQEITSGVVRLEVIEAVLGRVQVEDNKHFDTANVRAALPALKEGTPPNLRQISENVQLANDSPARQMEVTLAAGRKSGEVDARVAVVDQPQQRVYASLDNSGTVPTGRHRLGLAWQDANLMGGDEVLTLAYTTSPDPWLDHPKNVDVDVYSIAYRQPFYGIGDSVEVIYGNSNVDAPSVQATGFGLVGKGEVLALRWNHLLGRRGEYSSRLVFGLDYKYIDARCINPATGLPLTTTGSCVPYTVVPLSATLSGQWQGIGHHASYHLGLAWNAIASGTEYTGISGTAAAGLTDHYSFITGRPVDEHFAALRYGASFIQRIDAGWQVRAALTAQYAVSALPPAEQIGLSGAMAVRGFDERVVSADTGHVLNLEVYTPNLAKAIGWDGTLQALVFYDLGRAHNVDTQGLSWSNTGIASIGAGLRYSLRKDLSFSLDAADVRDPGPAGLGKRNSWGGHFRLQVGF